MTEQRSDELTLPANEPTPELPRPEPTPSPLDMDTFQRLLAQHDREAEHKLLRALADLERARRESSRTPFRGRDRRHCAPVHSDCPRVPRDRGTLTTWQLT